MLDEEEVIPTLILTHSQHCRFIEEQKEIIRKLRRDFYPEREVCKGEHDGDVQQLK